jgi:hypothetical protein
MFSLFVTNGLTQNSWLRVFLEEGKLAMTLIQLQLFTLQPEPIL